MSNLSVNVGSQINWPNALFASLPVLGYASLCFTNLCPIDQSTLSFMPLNDLNQRIKELSARVKNDQEYIAAGRRILAHPEERQENVATDEEIQADIRRTEENIATLNHELSPLQMEKERHVQILKNWTVWGGAGIIRGLLTLALTVHLASLLILGTIGTFIGAILGCGDVVVSGLICNHNFKHAQWSER
jgi:hypothetical protein